MSAAQIFSVVNAAALLCWLLLLIAPRWKVTGWIVLSGTIPLLLACAYTIIVVFFFGSADGGFGSLPEVMKLFTNEWIVLAGWIHYLAFDLFVGNWEVRDARKLGISHWFVIPCLVLTFLFGPVGFLLYHIVRRFAAKSQTI